MNLRYTLGSIIAFPLLPLMYVQGKRIKASVPSLPEATGTAGNVRSNGYKKLRVITIGESTIAGVGVETHQEGFSGTLAQALSESLDASVDWRVYARSGYTVKKVTQKILPKIKEDEIDLIVIGMGGNDAFELNSPSGWKKDIQELIASLHSRFGDVPIIFTNMPPIKDFRAFTPLIKFVIGNLVELFGKELQDICDTNDNVYFSSELITVSNWVKRLNNKYTHADFFSDGVHPSKLTYQTWAKEMAGFIAEIVLSKK